MSKQYTILKTISLVLATSGFAMSVHADVVRCEGEAGKVTYTDTACGSDVQVAQLVVAENPQATRVIYQPAVKAEPVRSSRWAHIYVAPRNGKVDTESVRSAHRKMISLDRAPRQAQALNTLQASAE